MPLLPCCCQVASRDTSRRQPEISEALPRHKAAAQGESHLNTRAAPTCEHLTWLDCSERKADALRRTHACSHPESGGPTMHLGAARGRKHPPAATSQPLLHQSDSSPLPWSLLSLLSAACTPRPNGFARSRLGHAEKGRETETTKRPAPGGKRQADTRPGPCPRRHRAPKTTPPQH